MSRLFTRGLLAFGLPLFGVVLVVALSVEMRPTDKVTTKSYAGVVAENVSVGYPGVYGVEMVRCGKVSTRKLKAGGITLGGFTELVLEDLSVVLPQGDKTKTCLAADEETAGGDILPRLGLTKNAMRGSGLPVKFAKVTIDGLRLATLGDATNVVPRICARRAESTACGLTLDDCQLIDGSVTTEVGRASLSVEQGRIQMRWREGCLSL